MDKSALLLACLVCACQGRRVQIAGDEAPNSLRALAGLLQSFESPVSAGQANHRAHPASKGTASNAPKLGRRALLSAGAATAGAALLAAQPASALPKMSDGKWAKWSKADDGPFTEKFFEGFTETKTGLLYKVVEDGYGVEPKAGQKIAAGYAGYLLNGASFDSSYKRNAPLEFDVGVGRVIKGWDEALLGMKVGEKRILKIPPNLGYGSRGAGNVIPPDSTLVFFVELVQVS
mmetsp:Transcript_122396/g.216735  ORF Transcript_122396/g.216735 Transcript_122396/m.216735 type:complete len:233 (+) Transcript_122396:82-780(+)